MVFLFRAVVTEQMIQGLATGASVEWLWPLHPEQASGCGDEASYRGSQNQDHDPTLRVSRKVANRDEDEVPDKKPTLFC